MNMFDKFKQIGELTKLRSQAKTIQKSLKGKEIIYEEAGIEVKITADQEIREVKIHGEGNRVLVNVLNKAIKKSQKVAAKSMQSLAGDLFGLGG